MSVSTSKLQETKRAQLERWQYEQEENQAREATVAKSMADHAKNQMYSKSLIAAVERKQVLAAQEKLDEISYNIAYTKVRCNGNGMAVESMECIYPDFYGQTLYSMLNLPSDPHIARHAASFHPNSDSQL